MPRTFASLRMLDFSRRTPSSEPLNQPKRGSSARLSGIWSVALSCRKKGEDRVKGLHDPQEGLSLEVPLQSGLMRHLGKVLERLLGPILPSRLDVRRTRWAQEMDEQASQPPLRDSDVSIIQAFRVCQTRRFDAGRLPGASVGRCSPGAAPSGASRMASVLSSDGRHG
jgi:hypothetical protein